MTPDTGKWATIPDYINGITRTIWEDRQVAAGLAQFYAEDVIVRAATGVTTGNAGVVASTLATLHQFPDRQLLGEDVIAEDHSDGSFLSSHRLLSVMRHHGDGAFGRATGALVKSRIIADCVVVGARVVEEWLVRDGAAFAAALGMMPADLAALLVAADRSTGGRVDYFPPARDVAGAYQPRLSDDPAARGYADGWRRIWGDAVPATIRTLYAEGAAVTLPGGGVANGWAEIDRFAIGYLAALPGATFRIHSLTVNRAPDHPLRIAMRWSLDGTHSGFGAFGAPGGAPIHIMGINHAQMWGQRVVAEWILVDEVAIHKQRLDHAP